MSNGKLPKGYVKFKYKQVIKWQPLATRSARIGPTCLRYTMSLRFLLFYAYFLSR